MSCLFISFFSYVQTQQPYMQVRGEQYYYSPQPVQYQNLYHNSVRGRGNYVLQQQQLHNSAQPLQQGVPRMSYSPQVLVSHALEQPQPYIQIQRQIIPKPPQHEVPPVVKKPVKIKLTDPRTGKDITNIVFKKKKETILEKNQIGAVESAVKSEIEPVSAKNESTEQDKSFNFAETVQSIIVMNQRQDQQSEASKAPLSNTIPHVVSTLQELYKCPVCLEIFENPYTLPCQHPLCKECLDGLVHIDGGITIKCPLCIAVHLLDNNKEISCLKAPLTMKQTVECLNTNRSQTQAKQVCMEAGCKRDVVTYCVNSKTYLCKPCKSDNDRFLIDSQRYQSMKYSMNQDVIAPFCHFHESFETRCCSTCNKLCCKYCYVSKHKDHNVVLLREFNVHNSKIHQEQIEELQNVKINLESSKTISESFISSLNTDADAMRKVIKLNTRKIIRECVGIANRLEGRLLNVLDSHQTERCELLNKSIHENNFNIAKLSSVLEKVGQYKKKSEMERFYHYFEIKDIIENLYHEQVFGNKSNEGPSKPSFEVYNPSNDSDLVLTEMKDKFELLFDKILTRI